MQKRSGGQRKEVANRKFHWKYNNGNYKRIVASYNCDVHINQPNVTIFW